MLKKARKKKIVAKLKAKKKPKLSALILKGCKLDGPKVSGTLVRLSPVKGEPYDRVTGACALGAATIALAKRRFPKLDLGKILYGSPEYHALKTYPDLRSSILVERLPPVVVKLLKISSGVQQRYTDLHAVVTGLNDNTSWSREKIARVVKSLGY